MDLVVVGFMSPVSPTFVPAVSSSNRFGSPSKLAIGKLAAGVSVDNTTNSCGIVPLFVTSNVIVPVGTTVVAELIDHCWIETAILSGPVVPDAGAASGGADLEHAARTSTTIERIWTIHLIEAISSLLSSTAARV